MSGSFLYKPSLGSWGSPGHLLPAPSSQGWGGFGKGATPDLTSPGLVEASLSSNPLPPDATHMSTPASGRKESMGSALGSCMFFFNKIKHEISWWEIFLQPVVFWGSCGRELGLRWTLPRPGSIVPYWLQVAEGEDQSTGAALFLDSVSSSSGKWGLRLHLLPSSGRGDAQSKRHI